ncbi:MAG: radical SAM protein [Betaproteobacteria bacterium]|nr:radical SAM protein [Betaproteobacteria bacterium]
MTQYGFHSRLKSEFPSQVIVDVTEVCNLACIHCPHPEFKRSSEYGARYLDPALHDKMVDEVREHGRGCTQYLRYTSNGEPLVHPKIYDMLDYAVARSGVFVTLTSNGTIMNRKRVERLLASGLHLVDVSIDAHSEETYAQVRVNGDLRATRDNVLQLLEIKRDLKASTRVVVSFVEQAQNTHETSAFEQFWRAEGVDQVVVRRLHSAAGGVARIALELHRRQQDKRRYPCLYPWERILLNPKGELAFCPQDWVHGSVIADYRKVSIREVWQGEAYRRLREAHLSCDFSAHGFCGKCPDWEQTRWPGEGRSYADMIEEFAGPR